VFDEMPALNQLITSPYLLRMVVNILPILSARRQSLDVEDERDMNDSEDGSERKEDESHKSRNIKLTKTLIFDTFTEQEFLKSRDRLRKLSSQKESGFILPVDFNEVESFRKYSMHLAVTMFVNKETSVRIQGSDYRFNDEKIDKWDEFFTNSNPIPVLT